MFLEKNNLNEQDQCFYLFVLMRLKEKLLFHAKEKWKEADVILVGHYHQHGIIEKDDKKLIFLGDWLNKFLVTVYEGGVWKQIKWEK